MTRNRINLVGALLIVTMIVVGGCAHFMQEGERTIALEKTPAPVQASINKILAGNKADRIVVESEDGKTIYEVTYHVSGQERSADLTPAGEIIEQESDVEVSSLPAAVSGAVLNKYSGATIEEAADVTASGQHYFELGIKLSDGKERELQVGSDGTVREDKAEEEKEKEEK